jgi:glucose-6-phosphate dehydrogenase assembly protein OpcA
VRARILANLGRHPVISAVVTALLLPGGFVLVPVIAWWHRRRRRAKPATRSRMSGHRIRSHVR